MHVSIYFENKYYVMSHINKDGKWRLTTFGFFVNLPA